MWRKRRRVSATLDLRDPRIGLGLGAARGLALGERLVGKRFGAGAKLLDRGERVVAVERAVVALVDRGHRSQVAGAEALEALDEELAVRGARAVVVRLVGIGAGGRAERAQEVVGAVQPARDVVAD